METFRLWLEKDKAVPQFRRLAFETVNVPIADVLLRGIHPWQSDKASASLREHFLEIVNAEEMKPSELAQFGYCTSVVDSRTSNMYLKDTTTFEDTLKHVQQCVCFVDGLSYTEVVAVARERLQRCWSHRVVRSLLKRLYPRFDALREFLKAKDKSLKLPGYADIDDYDLAEILSLADFPDEDDALVQQALPIVNFRAARFLERVTDDGGLLKLTDSIRHFHVTVWDGRPNDADSSVGYKCQRDGDLIRLRPELGDKPGKRTLAKAIASRWGENGSRYCFTADISALSQMLEQDRHWIGFPSLNYMNPKEPSPSWAQVAQSRITLFSVGKFRTANASVESIKDILRNHGVSMTGRKEQLLEKLARLAVQVYKQKVRELNAYFGERRFIRAQNVGAKHTQTFPLLEDLDIRNMVLTMYIMKHLRGNTILEAGYENDTFDLLSLATSLVKGEVTLTGSFLRVE